MLRSVGALLFTGLVLTVGETSHGALLETDGFESPAYAAGALAGQQGWAASAEFSVVNDGLNAHSGSQYLGTSGSAGSIGAVNSFTESTASEIVMDGWFYVAAGTQWIDVQIRDGDNNASFVALGFQNAENGFVNNIVYRQNPSLGGAYTALATYTPDSWFQIQVIADDVTSSPLGTYDVYLNGGLIGSSLLQRSDSADSIGRISFNAEPSAVGFRVDDLSLNVVPEPTSLGLIGIGIIGLLGSRRKRA